MQLNRRELLYGAAATAAGELAALLGTYAVLLQLLLMSRIAWLERTIGLDRLAVVHRWTGFALVLVAGWFPWREGSPSGRRARVTVRAGGATDA